jgi:hypothetical protein
VRRAILDSAVIRDCTPRSNERCILALLPSCDTLLPTLLLPSSCDGTVRCSCCLPGDDRYYIDATVRQHSLCEFGAGTSDPLRPQTQQVTRKRGRGRKLAIVGNSAVHARIAIHRICPIGERALSILLQSRSSCHRPLRPDHSFRALPNGRQPAWKLSRKSVP